MDFYEKKITQLKIYFWKSILSIRMLEYSNIQIFKYSYNTGRQ